MTVLARLGRVREGKAATATPPQVGWRSLYRNPWHAPELAVLNTLPLLSPRVALGCAERATDGDAEETDRLARRTLRRSVRQARRAGAITGSSFYVGMAPAVAMIYAEQLVMVLRIAAIYGRDPEDPGRVADVLVFQRRFRTVAEAEAAIAALGDTKPTRQELSWSRRVSVAIRQIPPMIGLQVRRISHPIDVLIAAGAVAGFFIPLVSIPVWTYANGRSTKRLGVAAMRHYGQAPAEAERASTIVLPRPATVQARRRMMRTLVGLIIVLAVVAPFVPRGRISHLLPLGGIVLAEFALIWTGLRLALLTRPARTDQPKPVPASRG